MCTTQNVQVSEDTGGSGGQANRMGMFQLQPTLTSNGKSVYKNSNGQYLYYWPAFLDWRIGADYTKTNAGVTSTSNTDTRCPQDSSGWRMYVDGGWKAGVTVVAGTGTGIGCVYQKPVGI